MLTEQKSLLTAGFTARFLKSLVHGVKPQPIP